MKPVAATPFSPLLVSEGTTPQKLLNDTIRHVWPGLSCTIQRLSSTIIELIGRYAFCFDDLSSSNESNLDCSNQVDLRSRHLTNIVNSFPMLQRIDLSNCRHLSSVDPLLRAKNLCWINLQNTSVKIQSSLGYDPTIGRFASRGITFITEDCLKRNTMFQGCCTAMREWLRKKDKRRLLTLTATPHFNVNYRYFDSYSKSNTTLLDLSCILYEREYDIYVLEDYKTSYNGPPLRNFQVIEDNFASLQVFLRSLGAKSSEELDNESLTTPPITSSARPAYQNNRCIIS